MNLNSSPCQIFTILLLSTGEIRFPLTGYLHALACGNLVVHLMAPYTPLQSLNTLWVVGSLSRNSRARFLGCFDRSHDQDSGGGRRILRLTTDSTSQTHNVVQCLSLNVTKIYPVHNSATLKSQFSEPSSASTKQKRATTSNRSKKQKRIRNAFISKLYVSYAEVQ